MSSMIFGNVSINWIVFFVILMGARLIVLYFISFPMHLTYYLGQSLEATHRLTVGSKIALLINWAEVTQRICDNYIRLMNILRQQQKNKDEQQWVRQSLLSNWPNGCSVIKLLLLLALLFHFDAGASTSISPDERLCLCVWERDSCWKTWHNTSLGPIL